MSPTYVIEKMDRHKGGVYICTANNGVGHAISQINLHVLCKSVCVRPPPLIPVYEHAYLVVADCSLITRPLVAARIDGAGWEIQLQFITSPTPSFRFGRICGIIQRVQGDVYEGFARPRHRRLA